MMMTQMCWMMNLSPTNDQSFKSYRNSFPTKCFYVKMKTFEKQDDNYKS